MRRPLSLRTWLVLGVIGIVIVSYAGTFGLIGFSSLFEPPDEPKPMDPPAVVTLQRQVEGQPQRWTDPTWQEDVKRQLDALGMQVTIEAHDGTVIFAYPYNRFYVGDRHVTVLNEGQPIGEVRIGKLVDEPDARDEFDRWQDQFMFTGIAVLVALTVGAAVWAISRAILRPLRALSHASALINEQRLDFEVPTSPIREVNEFARAFDQMREGLKESIARESALEQQRRELIAAVAHDLRTPLTSVRGYVEGLRDGVANTPDKRERYVQTALDKTATLEQLIESFFTYSKVDLLNQQPHYESVDLAHMLTAAADAITPTAAARQIRVQVDAGPPCSLMADRHMLSRVIDNLLDNAVRYTPDGGSIQVGWLSQASRVRFWVQDSGPGIPADVLPHVFTPGYRGDGARSTSQGGAGLGLSIVKRLVEAHGGTVRAETRDGARFTVTLPRIAATQV